MDNTLVNELRKIGLNEKAAKLYLTVLEIGGGYPSTISKKAGLRRSTAYDLLEKLSQEGLVNEIQKKDKKYYQINKSDSLLKFTERKIDRVTEQSERAKRIVPEISALIALSTNKPKVKFYEGVDGVLEVYEDHGNQKETYEMLAYSSVSGATSVMSEDFIEKYLGRKEKLNIKTRAIQPDTAEDRNVSKSFYKKFTGPKNLIPVSRFIPQELFPYEGDITMYGKDKISFINFKDGAYIGVIIQDVELSKMMRSIFELAWLGAKSFSK